ncbi:hypothetical protein P8452_66671 [Trifolium repens]|nr:hypothetical protein P8452_66671 [Trifolium repens]
MNAEFLLEGSKFATRVQRIDKLQNRNSGTTKSRIQNNLKRKRRRCTRVGVDNGTESDPNTVFCEVERFGFEPGPEFTLETFKRYADEFKVKYFRNDNLSHPIANTTIASGTSEPSVENIECEYWRMVESPTEEIEVLYGADLETGVFGSGFPINSSLVSDSNEQYVKSGWNLNNFARLPGSLLSYETGDISGIWECAFRHFVGCSNSGSNRRKPHMLVGSRNKASLCSDIEYKSLTIPVTYASVTGEKDAIAVRREDSVRSIPDSSRADSGGHSLESSEVCPPNPQPSGPIKAKNEDNHEKFDGCSTSNVVDNARAVIGNISCGPDIHRQKGPRIANVVRRINCNVEPLEFGVVLSGKSWCSSQAIFPKGFRSLVRCINILDPCSSCYYTSEILDDGVVCLYLWFPWKIIQVRSSFICQ